MSKIEWTDRTWNPVRGCSRVSAGCQRCYAERMASRFAGPGGAFEGFAFDGKWTGKVSLVPEKLGEPLHWRRPCRVFVNSMSDLFHELLPDSAILKVFDVMRQCPQHVFQILTKRPGRMRDFCQRVRFDGMARDGEEHIWLADDANGRGWRLMGGNGCSGMPWVWLGVSVEDQATANERIPLLLETPGAIRFVSAEPLLGPIRFELVPGFSKAGSAGQELLRNWWVIVGGESGPGARPCDVAWIRSLVEQCGRASVSCFVKQLGASRIENGLSDPGHTPSLDRLKSRKGADPLEWPEALRVREFPAVAFEATP